MINSVLIATDRIYDDYSEDYNEVLFGVFDSVEAFEKKLKTEVICMGITNINFRSGVEDWKQFWVWETTGTAEDGEVVVYEHHLTYSIHNVLCC